MDVDGKTSKMDANKEESLVLGVSLLYRIESLIKYIASKGSNKNKGHISHFLKRG